MKKVRGQECEQIVEVTLFGGDEELIEKVTFHEDGDETSGEENTMRPGDEELIEMVACYGGDEALLGDIAW